MLHSKVVKHLLPTKQPWRVPRTLNSCHLLTIINKTSTTMANFYIQIFLVGLFPTFSMHEMFCEGTKYSNATDNNILPQGTTTIFNFLPYPAPLS